MNSQKDISTMLNLIQAPAFCVYQGNVVQANPAAQAMMITPGMPVDQLISVGREAYREFEGELLYLCVSCFGISRGACVCRMDTGDLFILESGSASNELSTLALAARQLREPLIKVMSAAQRLDAAGCQEDAASLNRGLHQMLRILGNMSDAAFSLNTSGKQMLNISALVNEIFEKAQSLICHTGIRLEYKALSDAIYTLADPVQLERAILNILSNAVKFSTPGSSIEASFTRRGKILYLRLQDCGCGIADEILPTLFSRYLRQPAIEDSHFGLGLGMVLIRAAALNHEGTVLIDRHRGGTGITLTLPIRQSNDAVLRSPSLRVDYTGERDHALVELSDSLPDELYTL